MHSGQINSNDAAVSGGGVHVSGGTAVHFNMHGGSINNNIAHNTAITQGGGGVFMTGGNFTMHGTDPKQVENNTALHGAGIHMGGGIFTSTDGGSVSYNNTPNTAATWGDGTARGVGVFMVGGTGHINGGRISGNQASTPYSFGGGVYLRGGTLNMNGGLIGGTPPAWDTNPGAVHPAANLATNGGGVWVGSPFPAAGDGALFNIGVAAPPAGVTTIPTIAGNIATSQDPNAGGAGVMVCGNRNPAPGTTTPTGTTSRLIMGRGVITQHYSTGNTAQSGGGGVLVRNNAFFELRGGQISNNNAAHGGGVRIYDSVFNMTGGSIYGNTARPGGYGGGLHFTGAAVTTRTFNMTGGTIAGNTATTGGGVRIDGNNNIFAQNHANARVSGNTATSFGGGVSLGGTGTTTFNFTLGTIGGTGNITDTYGNTFPGGNTAANGGGVHVEAGRTFNILGAGLKFIEGNTANAIGNHTTDGGGGGVWLATGGNLTMAATARRLHVVNNSAPNGMGGGIFTMQHSNYPNPLPLPAYQNINLVVGTNTATAYGVNFRGNSASAASYPPENLITTPTAMTNINLNILTGASEGSRSSIAAPHQGNIHPLNNFDINFMLPRTDTDFTFIKHTHGTPSQTLQGATFQLFARNDANTAWNTTPITNGTQTSNTNGQVTFTALNFSSQYRLVETTAPTGYLLPTGCWLLTVDATGNITITPQDGAPAFTTHQVQIWNPGTSTYDTINRPHLYNRQPDWRRLNSAINLHPAQPQTIIIWPAYGTPGNSTHAADTLVGSTFHLVITDPIGTGPANNVITTLPILTGHPSTPQHPHRILIPREVTIRAATGQTIYLRMPYPGSTNTANAEPWLTTVDNLHRHFIIDAAPGNTVTLGRDPFEYTAANLPAAGNLIIDGNQAQRPNTLRGGVIVQTGLLHTFDGVTIRNNRAVAGGGVYLQNGGLTMMGGTIGGTDPATHANIATHGGGIFTNNGLVTLTLSPQLFPLMPAASLPNIIGNTANYGGGLFVDTTLSIHAANISGNTAISASATDGLGGGIHFAGGQGNGGGSMHFMGDHDQHGPLPINISNNTARMGGGVYFASGYWRVAPTRMGAVNITDNTATHAGGGIAMTSINQHTADAISGGLIHTQTFVISRNHATGPQGRGGGIYMTWASGTGEVTDIHFKGLLGGAAGCLPTCTTCDPTPCNPGDGNTAYQGGGVAVRYGARFRIGNIAASAGPAEIAGNRATNSGGGVHLYGQNAGSRSYLGTSNSTIRYNWAGQTGGGLALTNNSEFVLIGTGTKTIHGNRATDGGGVWVAACSEMYMTSDAFNLFISGNIASGMGGGVFTMDHGDYPPTLPYHPLATPVIGGRSIYFQNITFTQGNEIIPGVVFSNNQANALANPPANVLPPATFATRQILIPNINIGGAGTTPSLPHLGYHHPLNNYDINWMGAGRLFEFYKHNHLGEMLPGAHFRLFRTTADVGTGDNGLVTFTGATPNAPWEEVLLPNPLVSNGPGGDALSFMVSVGFTYQLVETLAPSGFQIPMGQWRIVVNDASPTGFTVTSIGNNTIPPLHYVCGCTGACTGDGNWYLANMPEFSLPMSGGRGTMLFAIAGSATLVMTAIAAVIFTSKKKKALASKARARRRYASCLSMLVVALLAFTACDDVYGVTYAQLAGAEDEVYAYPYNEALSWQEAYHEKLLYYAQLPTGIEDTPNAQWRFILHDINQDGIPELILAVYYNGLVGYRNAYSYVDGEVIRLKSALDAPHAIGMLVPPNGAPGIIRVQAGGFAYWYDKLTISSTTLSVAANGDVFEMEEGGHFRINAFPVTEEEFVYVFGCRNYKQWLVMHEITIDGVLDAILGHGNQLCIFSAT